MSPTVYVAALDSAGLVKVGWSADVPRRLRQLEYDHGPLRLIRTFPGNFKQERAVHGYLSRFRVRNEWFLAAPSIPVVLAMGATIDMAGRSLPFTVLLDPPGDASIGLGAAWQERSVRLRARRLEERRQWDLRIQRETAARRRASR